VENTFWTHQKRPSWLHFVQRTEQKRAKKKKLRVFFLFFLTCFNDCVAVDVCRVRCATALRRVRRSLTANERQIRFAHVLCG
jgi:hypothetical protein